MARFRSPVEREQPPAFRAGEKHEGDVCRTPHPVYGWGWYAVDNGRPNFEKPLRWVDEGETKEDGDGHWEFAKDVV